MTNKAKFGQKSVNQSMVDNSENSRGSKTGFKSSGNPALQPGIKDTKGKR